MEIMGFSKSDFVCRIFFSSICKFSRECFSGILVSLVLVVFIIWFSFRI